MNDLLKGIDAMEDVTPELTCSHCGQSLHLVLTEKEVALMQQRMNLQEVLKETRSPILAEQARLCLCDKCFTKYLKEGRL